jgi:hypothetical protein
MQLQPHGATEANVARLMSRDLTCCGLLNFNFNFMHECNFMTVLYDLRMRTMLSEGPQLLHKHAVSLNLKTTFIKTELKDAGTGA